jgi:hypothetical protein
MSAEDGGLSVALGTGEDAMKKLFAYAAIALFGAGALILATHSDAKPGGFGGGFKGKAWAFAKPHIAPHHPAAPPHHFAHAHDFDRHRHRFARGFDFPYIDFDAPYAAPLIVEVPQETDDVTGSTGPRRVSVWHGYGPHNAACSTENVTVPSSQGGETTVHVIRC